MFIQRESQAVTKYEYGCDLRRLYPWDGVANPLWGAAIASVRPGESTSPHSHDESETFIVLSGQGLMKIGEETAIMRGRDVVFIPKGELHQFTNLLPDEPLIFLSIYWDSPEARVRMKTLVSEVADEK
jgi:mannose-6-phosphate isomerase-like protein (cupin superfamily)